MVFAYYGKQFWSSTIRRQLTKSAPTWFLAAALSTPLVATIQGAILLAGTNETNKSIISIVSQYLSFMIGFSPL